MEYCPNPVGHSSISILGGGVYTSYISPLLSYRKTISHLFQAGYTYIYIYSIYPEGGKFQRGGIELEYTWLQKTLAANNNLWQD